MAKKSKNNKDYNSTVYTGDNNISSVDFATSIRGDMLISGANINYMRQVPDLRDGLKPVERRILYIMYTLGLNPKAPIMKSARIVGDVMSKFHPHGDSAIYDVLVRMTQTWNMYIPLAKDTGNFGSQYKNGGAAMRYTDTAMTEFAWECFFSDFDEHSIFMRDSYDGKNKEPEYLPSKYPVGPILGTMGIASGYRVDIPQYNPTEVMKLAIQRITDPIKKVKPILPDSVTYSDIVDSEQMQEIFTTGNGTVRYRGKVKVDYDDNTIVLYAPPIRVYLDKVMSSMSKLIREGKIKGVVNFRRYIIEDGGRSFDGWLYKFRKDVDLDDVVRTIYKRTRMDDTLPVNFLFLDNYREVPYSVINYIDDWIELRREYKFIRYTRMLRKTYEQIHTLETILMIFEGENGPKVVKQMQKVKSAEAQKYLMDNYGISSLQARTITNMSIGAFTKDSMQTYKDRLPTLRKEQKRIQKTLSGNDIIDVEIVGELEDGIKRFGEPRRSKMIQVEGADNVPNTEHMLITTKKGYVKKLDARNKEVGALTDGDIPTDILSINNRDHLLVLDSAGYIHKLAVNKIPSTELESPGLPVSDFLKMRGKVVSILANPNDKYIENYPESHILMVTKQGAIKKTLMSEFTNMRTTVVCIKMDKDDELAMTMLVDDEGDDDIFVYTNNGMGVRYPSLEVKPTGRASKGIKAISALDDDDYIIGIDIFEEKDKFLLCVTDKGRVKKCELNYFRTMKRESKPLRVITLDDRESINTIQGIKGKEKFMVFMRQGAEMLDTKEIEISTRLSKANKTIHVKRGDNIISIKEH